jgi:hypothetical protein
MTEKYFMDSANDSDCYDSESEYESEYEYEPEISDENYKYMIKETMMAYKRDWKTFNNDIEFFNYCKSINFQFHLINNETNESKCLFFDVDNTILNKEEIANLINEIFTKEFNTEIIPNLIVEQRKKVDKFSYHIHINNCKILPLKLKFAIDHFLISNEAYLKIIDTMIYTKNHSFRYSMAKKDHPNDRFVKLDRTISQTDFFKTINSYTNNAVEIDLIYIDEFNNKCNKNFLSDKNTTIELDHFKDYKEYADRIINTFFNEKLISNYDEFYKFCYMIAAITSGDGCFKRKLSAKMIQYKENTNSKFTTLNDCFIRYPQFVTKSPMIMSMLNNYVDSFKNTSIKNNKSSEYRGNINHFVSTAGSNKTNDIINSLFSTKNFADCNNFLCVTPRRLNSNDIKGKFLRASFDKKNNKPRFIDIENYTLNDYLNNIGVIIVLEENITIKNANDKMHQILKTPLKDENNNFNEKINDDVLFNKIRVCIVTTDKSLFKVINYTKETSIYFDILIIDEMIQVVENIQKSAADLTANNTDMSFYLYNMIQKTETVYLSNIYDISLNNLFPLRKINIVQKDYTIPNIKFMSYSNITISNTQEDFDNIIKTCDGCFIWSDLNTECQKIFQYLLNNNIDKNNIVCLTANNTWSNDLLKYKYIIASPKIFSCISIGLEDDYDRKVIAVIRSNHISNYNIINSIQRVRKCQTLAIFTNNINNIKKNEISKKSYLYDSDIDNNFNNLIKQFNTLTMQQMIESLKKNDDYIYNENITEDKSLRLKFDYNIIIEKPKYNLCNKQIEFIKLSGDDIIKDAFKKHTDLIHLTNLADEILILKPIDCIRQIDFITNFGKVKSDNDRLNAINYLLILQLNQNAKILKKYIIKYSNIREFKTHGNLFNELDNKIKNTNKIKFQEAKKYINMFKTYFDKLNYDNKLDILTQIKTDTFDYKSHKKQKDTSLNKQIIQNMEIKQNDKVTDLNTISIFNINNYIESLDDTDAFKNILLARKSETKFTRPMLTEFNKRNVFDNCLNYKICNDKNNHPKLLENIEFSIDWRYDLLNTEEVAKYFRSVIRK